MNIYMGVKKLEFINDYFNQVLSPLLLKEGVEEPILNLIHKDINNRILSLLIHWGEEEFINPILFIGKEEALHYKPKK